LSEDLRHEVALGCRVLGEEDQGDLVWGHVSARDPEGRGVWMKASTYGFEEIGPERVILVDREGHVLEGSGRRHAEYPIHTEITAARGDVGAVVHTHSPPAVALGATGHPLRPISHEANLFVPPELARFTKTGDLILTAATLRPRSATATRSSSSTTASSPSGRTWRRPWSPRCCSTAPAASSSPR
jgi:ribulose-5-phosphate 4-epimerase/fuculose-1-phosphate aldolase